MKNIHKLFIWTLVLLISSFIIRCDSDLLDIHGDIDGIEVLNDIDADIIYKNSSIVKKIKLGGFSQTVERGVYGVPKWSMQGSKFAYIKYDYSDTIPATFLVICDKNGLKINEWFIHSGTVGSSISWSNDGDVIALLNTNHVAIPEIYYLSVSTGEFTIEYMGSEKDVKVIAWMPNTNKLSFSDGNSIKTVIAFKHDSIKVLAIPDISVEYLDWSNDGSKLVYSGNEYGDIYIVNKDGSNNHKIMGNKEIIGKQPCWMIDNEKIIFTGVVEKYWDEYGNYIYVPGLFATDITGSIKVYLEIKGESSDCY